MSVEKTFELNNCYYASDCYLVELLNVQQPFIKVMLEDPPKRWGWSTRHKDDKKQCAAYAIRDIDTGKIYLGSSSDIYTRTVTHRHSVRMRKHGNENFNELLKTKNIKYFELFVFFTDSREKAYDIEQFLIDHFKDSGLMLNISTDSRKNTATVLSPNFTMRGRVPTEEHRKNISVANTGKIMSEETRVKISQSRKTSPLALSQLSEIHEKSRRRVMINCVEYESITKAREATGLSETVIRKMIDKCEDSSTRWLEDSKNPLAGRTLPLELRQKLSAIKKHKGMEQFEKMREMAQKPIILNGVLYKSVREAVRLTGISEPVIHRKLKEFGGKDTQGPYVLDYNKPIHKKVMFNDVVYDNVLHAADSLGISKNTMKSRVRAGLASYV